MIRRHIETQITSLLNYFSIVTLTGPRQSGKTTLLKNLLPNFDYVSLETPDDRARAIDDPQSFLAQYNKVILDEVQRTPELFSYIQTIVDNDQDRKFILSGSQNFLLLENISQTLAGRTALLKLLPFSISELKKTPYEADDIYQYIYNGAYPRLYDKKIPATIFYDNYAQTYVERDVRQIKSIENLNQFRLFLQLCAGRIGQVLNYNALATEVGIAVNTVKSWLSLLETSYIIYRLQPHHKNFSKRLIKSPKLYFYDTGLACNLLKIKSKQDLDVHFLRGSLFENVIINELVKSHLNNNLVPNIYYWRDHHGHEIDCIVEQSQTLIPIEIKSSVTFHSSFFKGLDYWYKLSNTDKGYLIYGGNKSGQYQKSNFLSWKNLQQLETRFVT